MSNLKRQVAGRKISSIAGIPKEQAVVEEVMSAVVPPVEDGWCPFKTCF